MSGPKLSIWMDSVIGIFPILLSGRILRKANDSKGTFRGDFTVLACGEAGWVLTNQAAAARDLISIYAHHDSPLVYFFDLAISR